MAIDLERILRERKYNAQKGRDDVGIVPYNGNGRGIVGKIPYTGKESNGGSAGASGNTQDGNVPSVKRTEPSDEVKNAVHKSLARISGIPMTGRDDVGIVPYSGNGGKSQGAVSLAPTRKNEFMLANMQKNYVSPEVKNAVDKAFERMGAVKAPSSPYSPYKTGSLDNQIKYAEQEYNARNEEYKDRLRMVRNRYTPEQGKAMLEKNKVINNQKDYRGAIDRADENLENLKNMRYNIDIKNKRTKMEKVVNNEDFERYSTDPGGKKEISFFRYIDPRYNAINQPIAYADEKERKIYFYYLEKEGQKKADEYYKTIERELTARRAVQKSKKDEKFGNEHKILASAETIAASIPALKDFNSEVRKYIKNKKNGTYEPMNPDSMNFDATRKQMDLEQGITKDMSGAGRFFTQTGLSMGKSLASSLFGKFGLAIMSGNAAAQSTFEALKNGATSRQALTKGLADGFTEYITEKVPFDNFFKIVKGGDIKGAKALLKNILKQAGAEGSGEALAEYMNYAIDRYVMGDKSDFNSLVNTYIENGYTANEAEKEAYKQYLIVNPALAFAGGAISGLGMGGVAQTTNYLAGKWQNHIEGKTAENKNAPSQQTENVQGNSSDMGVSSDGGVIFEPSAQNGISENIGNNTEPMQSVLKSGQIENDIDIDGEGIGNNQTEAEKLAGARLERILKNRFGVETVHFNDENGSKGYYDPKTKKIYTNDFYTVNRYATTAHEFFHSYKDIDVEGYNVIKKAVLADLSLEEYNKYKERQINLRNSNNLDTENIDIDSLVAEEVISDLGAEVLKNPESLEGIFKRFENDKTFIEKFMDYIRGLVRKVREFLNSDYIENDNDIRNLVKNYSEIENIYRSVLESGGTMDYSAEGNDTGVKYSIVQNVADDSGNEYKNAVLLDTDIFKNKPRKSYGKILKDYIYKNFAGKGITVFDENGNKEIIQFAGERERVTKENSQNSRKVIDKLAYKKDMRSQLAVAHADEIIQIAENSEFNNEHNHQWLDEKGWEFKTAILTDKNGNLFTATLNIANTRDGRKILYDINKIKSIGRATVPATAYGKQKGWRTNSNTSTDSVSHTSEDVKYKLPTAEEKQDEEMRKEAKKQLKKYFNEIKGDKTQTQAETTKPRQSKFDKFKEAYRQYTIPVPEKRERIFLPPRGEVTAYKKDVSERRETLLKAKKVAEKDFNNVQSDAEKSKIKNTLSLIEEYIRTNDKQKSLIKKIEQAYTEENNKRDTQKANTASERLAELERKERIRQADTAEREQIKIKRAKEKERAFWDGIEKKAEEYEIVKAKRALKEMAKAVRAEDERYIEFEERVTEKPVRISRLERMEKAAEDFKSNGDIHKLPKQSDYNAFKKAIADKDIYYDNLEHYIKNHIETAKKESDKRLSENTFDFETEQKISEKKIAENALDLFNKKRTEYENGEKERAKKVIQVLDEAYKVVDLDKAREKAYRMSQQNEEYEVVKAKRAMNEMSKEAKQATDEGLDIEKYYNTPREKRVTEKAVRAPRLERMEKASEDFKKTGDSFKLPKKSDYNSYKRDAQRKSIYYNNIETYMKNQLSGARSDVEYDVIKKALDMFLQKKVAYENGEKVRAQEVITSMDEAYKMLDTKRNFKLTKEIAEDITDKGKTVFSYKSKDFFRNMREVFGKHYGVVKDIIDDFNNSKGDMARSINERLADLYQTVVKDLGITKGSKESAAVMWYGEGEKAPDLTNADDIALLKKMGIKDFKKLDPDIKVKYDGARLEQDFGHGTAEKIRKADAYFRKVYDEYIDALNAEIKEIYPFNPKKQIQKRKNYYRHFDELTNTYSSLFEMLGQNANIDPKLAGISPYTKPKSKWSSIEQKRKGKATVEDAVGGFLNYIPMAEYRLNIDKHISVIRTLASDLAELKGDNGNANNFIKFLNDYANDLAGKTVSNLDRVLIDFGGRKIVKGLSWVNNRVKTNKVLGNIASSAKQILNQTNGFLVLENPKNMLSGYADWFKGTFGNDADILKRYGESNFLTERFVDDSFSKFEKKSLQSICANLLGATDEMGVRIIWNAAYNEALDINKTGGEKINPARYADDAARNACGGRGIGEVPLIYKSQVAKLALPFQLEVQNNWKVIYDYFANRGISGERIKPEKDVKKKIAKAVSFLIASFGLNWLTETLTGSKGSMDIIGDIADGFGQGFKEKKSDETWKKILQGTKRSAQNVSADVLDNRLFGWVYASILESIDEDYADKLFNGNFQSNGVNIPAGQSAVKIAKKARQGDFAGAGAEAMTSFVTPYGGAQIDKTIRGLTDWGKGAKYQNDAYKKVSKFFANRNSNDYEGIDGKKKYDIKKNPLTFVQSALFGPSALGGDYYNDQKTARYIEDEEKAQRAKREEKFRKNYKNESVIYLAKAQKDNDLIPYDEVKSDFKFTNKKQEYEFTIPKEAKEEYDKILLDEMEKEYDKVMDKPEYKGALNARKAEILKDAKSKARKTVNAKIKKDYLDGKFGE